MPPETAAPTHLLTVWNPSYADDAMDAHLRILLRWAQRRARGEAEPEDIYVWWAKLRSPRREGDLPHADDILALNEQLDSDIETHLYLTDYRSLYVGHLTAISTGDLLEEWPGEIDHMPSYYRGREADFWFYLRDIRRLVDADTPSSRARRDASRRTSATTCSASRSGSSSSPRAAPGSDEAEAIRRTHLRAGCPAASEGIVAHPAVLCMLHNNRTGRRGADREKGGGDDHEPIRRVGSGTPR